MCGMGPSTARHLSFVPQKNLVFGKRQAGKLKNHIACKELKASSVRISPVICVSGTCQLLLELLSYSARMVLWARGSMQ